MNNNSKALTRGGIYTALSVILIYAGTYSPTGKLSFLIAAAFIIPLSVITTDIKYSILVYFAVSVLSLILIGIKASPILYILFLGLYGFIKLYAEKTKNKIFEFLIKYLFFNVSIFVFYLIYKTIFTIPITSKLYLIILLIVSEVVFAFFDYIVTLFISYASNKLLK